ncbi:pimeloyl-CoA dehydrogenase [Niastella koreensis]|uniref:Pirin domain protein n=2 Tax=Niastella koreensis TaxID=354356 RepID=G8T864_NIAKG|nr:pirin-like C-terminal cupin domain-containing protein [Niastella koreensis]AEV98015.1 Pirin domain protein [Niastella koreensis GR20-10]OQP40186.1 pimeloyl-CoA dehydrogenase [Niastella koreensis]
MAITRELVRIESPKGEPGFLGAGHIARPLIYDNYEQSDPFILLMDDMLDKKDTTPAGGPHPHAGFETVTLVLDGELGADDHQLKSGDFQLMTAGSGVVHTEVIDKPGSMRILQLWANLGRENRKAVPRLQDLPLDHVPVINENGTHIRLYSGTLADITSPVQNYVPLLIADITVEPGVTSTLKIPANYNTFLYVLAGTVQVGELKNSLHKDQVGWLNKFDQNEESELKVTAGSAGGRFVLYGGKPLHENIVSHGPFIADDSEEIVQLYKEYRQGKMKHISTVPEAQHYKW